MISNDNKKAPFRFFWGEAPEMRGGLELLYNISVDKRLELVRATAQHCALCGSTPQAYGIYSLNDVEKARWNVNWCGFSLCERCLVEPDAKLRLRKRFEFELGVLGVTGNEL
jgi:hypothetical protein